MTNENELKNLTLVHTSQIRKGVVEKATGQAKYSGDITLPNMLFGAILRSPLPHARILNIDASRARNLKGVKVVLTGNEISRVKFGHSPARFDETAAFVDRNAGGDFTGSHIGQHLVGGGFRGHF